MRSISSWLDASSPSSFGAMTSLTLRTALSDRAFAAEVALLVAVAQFDRFVRAGAGSGRDRGSPDGAVAEDDVDLEGRIASAIEDFAGVSVLQVQRIRPRSVSIIDIRHVDGIGFRGRSFHKPC